MRFPLNPDWSQLALQDANPQSPEAVIEKLAELHQQGKLCIPALIELNCLSGCICISADLSSFLLNHPKALMVQRNLDFLNSLLNVAHQVETHQFREHFKLDPFSSHRMQHYSVLPAECLKALFMDLCPDWIDQPPKVNLCFPRTHEKAWRGDTAIFEATVSCHEHTYHSKNIQHDSADAMKAIEATYRRRDEQACNLISALGDSAHSAFYKPNVLPDYPELWSAFQAKREAMLLANDAKMTPARTPTPRM